MKEQRRARVEKGKVCAYLGKRCDVDANCLRKWSYCGETEQGK